MSYRLVIEKRAIKELKNLSTDKQNRIKDKIRTILTDDPFPKGKGDIKKIKGSKFWRLRVGEHRVFYDIDQEREMVFILSIRHRSTAYREI